MQKLALSSFAGSDVSTGNVNIPYVPSGPFEMKNNNTEVDMSTDYTHRLMTKNNLYKYTICEILLHFRYLFVVYKQPGRINVSCSKRLLFNINFNPKRKGWGWGIIA